MSVLGGSGLEHLLLEDIGDLSAAAEAKSEQEKARWRQGEVRPAALLFLDVVGFTSLSRKLTSEQLAMLVDRTFQLLIVDCAEWGGVLDRVIGDAALFVFAGSPDHPPPREAALRAGLAIVERVTAISSSLAATGLPLDVRVGAAWGEVTRHPVDTAEEKWSLTGRPVEVAQVLEPAAAHGSVLAEAGIVKGLEGRFRLELAESMDLPGAFDAATYRVLGAKEAPRFRTRATRFTPLVGREEELAAVLETVRGWWHTTYPAETLDHEAAGVAIEKRGRLLAITGDTAVGKSRLAWEVAHRLQEEDGAVTVTAHALKTGGGIAPFARELAHLGGLSPDGLSERFKSMLAAGAEAVSPEYAKRQERHLAMLAYLLQSGEVATDAIAKADAATFEMVARHALRALAELTHHQGSAPIVLVVEDMQWLGDLEGVVGNLLGSTALAVPLVVIGTAREPWHPPDSWDEQCRHEVIRLDPLTLSMAKALVQARLPGLELPEDTWGMVLDRAAGVPYYLEEFANLLVDRRIVGRGQDGRWSLLEAPDEVPVPQDVSALILSRLDRLPADLRDLLGKASVLGRAIQVGLLAAVETGLDTGDPESVPGQLALLSDEGFVYPGDDDDSPEPERYLFAHLLTRDIAYAALLPHNRRLLHRLAADSLLDFHKEGTAGMLEARLWAADHLERAGELHKALKVLTAGLHDIVEMGVSSRWESTWTNARGLLDKCRAASGAVAAKMDWAAPPGLDWLSDDDSPETVLGLAMAREMNERLWRTGETHEAKLWAERLLAHPRLNVPSPTHTSLLRIMASVSADMGDVEESLVWCEKALAAAEVEGDRLTRVRALNGVALCHKDLGRTHEAEAMFLEIIAELEELGQHSMTSPFWNNLGLVYRQIGNLEEDERCMRKALEVARSAGRPRDEVLAMSNLGTVLKHTDRFEEAEAAYRETAELAKSIEARSSAAYAIGNLAVMHSERGALDQARPVFEELVGEFEMMGDQRALAATYMHLGDIDSDLGHFGEANRMYRKAEALAEKTADIHMLGSLFATRAVAEHLSGDTEQAEKSLQRARDVAESVGSGVEGEVGRAIAKAEERIAGS